VFDGEFHHKVVNVIILEDHDLVRYVPELHVDVEEGFHVLLVECLA
jgi:hypothetical protein